MSSNTSKRDFKYCVWLVPEKEHEWHKYTNGFDAHMTVQSDIKTEDEAYALFASVAIEMPENGVIMKLTGDSEQHNELDFNAIVYNVECDQLSDKIQCVNQIIGRLRETFYNITVTSL